MREPMSRDSKIEKNDGQVDAGVPTSSRWLDARLRSKPVPHHRRPPGLAIDVTEH